MKIASVYLPEKPDLIRLVAIEDEQAHPIVRRDGGQESMVEWIRQGTSEASPNWTIDRQTTYSLDQLDFLPPVTTPEKIICVGRNYAEHASEMGEKLGQVPVIFSKFNTALTGHGKPVRLPELSEQVDFEAELVVVIGQQGRHIDEKDATGFIYGFTCGNDISARDWQKGKPGGQWLLGKSFQTFAPLGPWLVTADEFGPPFQFDVELRLNQQTMQSASTSQLIFSIEYLISHLSKFFTLAPGDLLFTGTPPGVGAARNPPVFLKPGDDLQVEISGIGTLQNPVKAEC